MFSDGIFNDILILFKKKIKVNYEGAFEPCLYDKKNYTVLPWSYQLFAGIKKIKSITGNKTFTFKDAIPNLYLALCDYDSLQFVDDILVRSEGLFTTTAGNMTDMHYTYISSDNSDIEEITGNNNIVRCNIMGNDVLTVIYGFFQKKGVNYPGINVNVYYSDDGENFNLYYTGTTNLNGEFTYILSEKGYYYLEALNNNFLSNTVVWE